MKPVKIITAIALTVLMSVTVCACTCNPAETYSVVFDTRGGSAVQGYTLAEGDLITRPADPAKEMFTFSGWYEDAAITTPFTFETQMPAHDVTIYAGWTALESVRVNLNANGGAFANATDGYVIGECGAAFAAPAVNPAREGYSFGGWYTEPECENAYSFTVFPENEITLYAKWGANSSYAYVNYYGNGELVSQVPVKKGEASKEAELFPDGIISTGWFTDENMSQPYTFGGAVNADVNLYTTYYTDGLTIENGVVTAFDGFSETVIVPNKFAGVEVTGIGAYAFYVTSEINSVTQIILPKTITTIGEGAFYDCRYLASVNLTEKVTSIGARAFYNNERLTSFGDISSVKVIPEGAFLGCKKLYSLTLSEEVTEIGAKAFADCESLKELIIPAGVTVINEYLFSGCKSLVSVEINAPVLGNIAEGAFNGCKALESITINSAVRANFAGVAEGNGASIFADCVNAKIYVPATLVQSYKDYCGSQDNGALANKFTAKN